MTQLRLGLPLGLRRLNPQGPLGLHSFLELRVFPMLWGWLVGLSGCKSGVLLPCLLLRGCSWLPEAPKFPCPEPSHLMAVCFVRISLSPCELL
jgi:hypothetical protein